ncbi:SGNH/GDSL hydrolase family protein [Cereibacter sp. SYSU M97828]|nr:SGNH/GDSL hydrolase family protein [Cereibacter flavus]
MLRLNLARGPSWLDLRHGVKVEVLPLNTEMRMRASKAITGADGTMEPDTNRAINATTGALSTDGAFWATDFIPVKANVGYSFTAPATQKNWAFYNAAQEFISAQSFTGYLVPPAGAAFVRGCNRYLDVPPEAFVLVEGTALPAVVTPYVGELAEAQINKGRPNGYAGLNAAGKLDTSVMPDTAGSPLAGKVLAGLGDSITYGFIPRNYPGYPGRLSSYLQRMGEKLGAAQILNHGISGSTLAYDAARNPMCRRLADLDNTADLIIVMGGTNDVRNGIALGQMGDSTDATYYGALDVIARGLLEKYRYGQGTAVGAGKKIVFATPIRLIEQGSGQLNAQLPAFQEAVLRVGEKYAIPVFDSYNDSGLTPELFQTLQGAEEGYTGMYNPFVTDGTHPTAEGHQIFADAFSGFVRGLY